MSRMSLDELAAAIADRTPIDWRQLAAEPESPVLAMSARLVERIAEFHQQLLPSEPGSATSGSETPDYLWDGADIPTTWGPLTIRERIGGGAYGEVFLADDPRLNRRVALKLLRGTDRRSTTVVDEGHRLARVRHPNVVTVHGAEWIDGRAGLWMEYVDGQTLEAELRARGPFPPEEVAAIGADLAGALDAVHSAGLVHRDVKAQNVMREASGRVVLTDFGAGRDLPAVDGVGGLEVAGTPLYLAPEVLSGQPASAASDVYGLGVLLYHLSSGTFPVGGHSLDELRRNHGERLPTPLRSVRPAFPRTLARIIERAIDPDPARRYTTAEQLRAALHRPSWSSRARFAAAAAILVIAVVSAVAAWSAWSRRLSVRLGFKTGDYVLVSRFENKTGEAIFDGAIESALERALATSDLVSVVPRYRVQDALDLMKRPRDLVVDREIGREVALRDSQIKALVAGRIERFGSRYLLTAEVVDPRDASIVVSQSEEAAGQEEVLEALQRHAQRLRRALGDTVARLPARPAVEPVTTASLKALQLYNDSLRLAHPGNEKAATALAREAVAEDPEFATGWVWLAWLLRDPRNPGPSREVAARATSLAGSASQWERLWIQTIDRYLAGDPEQAIASSLALLELRPDYSGAAETLSLALAGLNRRGEHSTAFKRLADLRPLHVDANLKAAQSLVAASSDDAVARPYVERVRMLIDADPDRKDSPAALWIALFEAYADWRHRRIESAEAQLRRIVGRFSGGPRLSGMTFGVHNFHVSLGQLDRADEVLALMPDEFNRERHRLGVLAAAGNPDAFRVQLLALEPAMRERNWAIGPRSWLHAGLIDRARAVAATGPSSAAQTEALRGELALLDGRAQDAIPILSTAFTMQRGQTNMGEYHRTCQALARAFSSTGRNGDAVQQLEGCAAQEPYLNDTFYFGTSEWMRTRLQLADEYRVAGRRDDAEVIEADLRRLLAVADADYPLLKRLNAR